MIEEAQQIVSEGIVAHFRDARFVDAADQEERTNVTEQTVAFYYQLFHRVEFTTYVAKTPLEKLWFDIIRTSILRTSYVTNLEQRLKMHMPDKFAPVKYKNREWSVFDQLIERVAMGYDISPLDRLKEEDESVRDLSVLGEDDIGRFTRHDRVSELLRANHWAVALFLIPTLTIEIPGLVQQ